ncbi:MAG: hypothetical protein KDI48_04120 [Xanthomonadales bacterium]|nr:hypothetical protein [Xanthomonadales bacterium]
MSTVKSPQAKKRLSLARDGRNDFGENAKASRKNIPRAKARSIRAERRGVGQALAVSIQAADPIDAEMKVREVSASKARAAFRKYPDKPLGEVLIRKQARRRSAEES